MSTESVDYVTLDTGTLVGRCGCCGVVSDEEIESGATAGVRTCGHCSRELPKVVSLSKPMEVSRDALA